MDASTPEQLNINKIPGSLPEQLNIVVEALLAVVDIDSETDSGY